MDTLTGQDQQALLAQLAAASAKVDDLMRDLREVEGELEGRATERRQHRLLHDVCEALEELGEIGGAGLFWGERVDTSADQLRRVRSRVDVFEKELGLIEDRHQAVLEAISQQQREMGWLEDDVFEAQEAERERQEEWIIEREVSLLPYRALIMPWTRGGEDDVRFRKSVGTSLSIALLIMWIVPQIPIPKFLREEPAAVPERLTRLIVEKRPVPKPVPEGVKPVVPKESPLLAEQPAPRAAKKSAGPGQGPGEGPGEGPGKGLMAFRDQLGAAVNQQLARLGADARVSTLGAASSAIERSMISTSAPGSSGGINLAAISRGVNGGGAGGGASAISGVQIARATSNIVGGGGGAGAANGTGHGAMAGRTDEEIQIVFDRHKAELYRLYNRELRRDPTLRGQMILHMTIQPDGSVSLCELRATDMNAPQLVVQVVDRVRGFDFGAKEGIGAVTILYPIDFLPAA